MLKYNYRHPANTSILCQGSRQSQRLSAQTYVTPHMLELNGLREFPHLKIVATMKYWGYP